MKEKDPNIVQITIRLPRHIWTRLKIASAKLGPGQLNLTVEQAITRHLITLENLELEAVESEIEQRRREK